MDNEPMEFKNGDVPPGSTVPMVEPPVFLGIGVHADKEELIFPVRVRDRLILVRISTLDEQGFSSLMSQLSRCQSAITGSKDGIRTCLEQQNIRTLQITGHKSDGHGGRKKSKPITFCLVNDDMIRSYLSRSQEASDGGQ